MVDKRKITYYSPGCWPSKEQILWSCTVRKYCKNPYSTEIWHETYLDGTIERSAWYCRECALRTGLIW